MTVTEQVAGFVVDTSLNDIPQKTVQYAKELALCNLGSMMWGSTLPASRIVTRFIRDIGGTPEAGVIGGGFKTSLPNAALANGNFAHSSEWEGDSRPEMVGVMTVFPVVFPVAEKVGASGKDVLEAAIIAHEVQSRIGLACLPATGRGFFAVPVFGNFGATVAAARLLKLNEEQICNAFGLVASQAAGTLRHHSTMTHFVETGFACRNGVTAALLAGEGINADMNILEDTGLGLGFGSAVAGKGDYVIQKVTEGLGKEFRFNLLDTKVFPCHSLQQRPLEAALHLVSEHGIAYDDVESVEVEMSPGAVHELDLLEPPDGEHTRVSLQHGIAGVLLEKRADRHIFTEEKRVDPGFREARGKVKLIPRPEWTVSWPEGFDIVTIKLKNGQEHSVKWEAWRGFHKTPMTTDELIAKYRDGTSEVLSPARADRSIELVLELENIKDISELAEIIAFPG
ncbi:MAG: MmgE/PrpD family protein [Chloroflexota bacterium]